jgi:hypothetical protein
MRTITVVAVVLVAGLSGVFLASTTAVASGPPLADAGLDQTVTPGTTVHLDANGSRDPDGQIRSVQWSLDGPAGSSATPDCRSCRQTTFTPTTVGQYNVTLRVTDDDGHQRSDTLRVLVEPDGGPTVSVTGPKTTSLRTSTTYRAVVSAGTTQLDTLAWVVDGTLVRRNSIAGNGTTSTLSQRFTATGQTTVRAVAYDSAGRQGSATRQVTVLPSGRLPPGPAPAPSPSPSPGPPSAPSPGPPSAPSPGPGPGGPGPSLSVTSLTAPDRTTVGTAVPITAIVENAGAADGRYTARLRVDGRPIASQTIAVDAGESESLAFDHAFARPGNYTVSVGNRSTTVRVVRSISNGSGRIFVDSIQVPSDVQRGTRTTVHGTVVNTDTTVRTLDATFAIDGWTHRTRSVTVSPGETALVDFEYRFDATGQRTVSIENESETVTVVAPIDPPEFRVNRLEVPNRSLDVGETGAIFADVRNTGDRAGRYRATLLVDGTAVTTKQRWLRPGGTKRIGFARSFSNEGTHTVRVGSRAKSIQVADLRDVWVTDIDAPEAVESGERFDVDVTVRNTDTKPRLTDIPLYIGGDKVGTKTDAVLYPGTWKTLTFRNQHIEHRGAFERKFEIRSRFRSRNITVVPPTPDSGGGNAGSNCDGGYVWTDDDGNVIGCLDANSTDIHYSDDGEDVWIDANGKDGLQISRNNMTVTIMNETEVDSFGGKVPGEVVEKEKNKIVDRDIENNSPDVNSPDRNSPNYNPGPEFKPGDDGDCGAMGCSTSPPSTDSGESDDGDGCLPSEIWCKGKP